MSSNNFQDLSGFNLISHPKSDEWFHLERGYACSINLESPDKVWSVLTLCNLIASDGAVEGLKLMEHQGVVFYDTGKNEYIGGPIENFPGLRAILFNLRSKLTERQWDIFANAVNFQIISTRYV